MYHGMNHDSKKKAPYEKEYRQTETQLEKRLEYF